MPNSELTLADHAKATMDKGSKSFSLAALLFDSKRRRAARYLYSWCRHCDDLIDEAPDRATALLRLEELRQLTTRALNDQKSGLPAFEALREVVKDYGIPDIYPLELLEGMRMDVEGSRYQSQADLELYCYRVASVVGLMMVHVMGISSPDALRPAVDTGLAMQMTNIARDVREDFELGRVYLPKAWFDEAGRPYPEPGPRPATSFSSEDTAIVVKKLLILADRHYESGRRGLRFLPLRAALAVGVAQTIYREIGVYLLKRGRNAWDKRTVVPLSRKLALLLRETALILIERMFDFKTRWHRCELRETFGPGDLLNHPDVKASTKTLIKSAPSVRSSAAE